MTKKTGAHDQERASCMRMTIRDALSKTGIEQSDAEILLCHALNVPRSRVLSHPEQEITSEQEVRYREYIQRRKRHEPVAYITEKKEFFGMEFAVNPHVLIPRPATEELVREVVRVLQGEQPRKAEVDTDITVGSIVWKDLRTVRTVIDIGTGSGCIAIALAVLMPNLRCIATDTSAAALDTAKANAQRHGVTERCTFVQGNLLEPVQEQIDPFLLVSNPPYITSDTLLMEDVQNYEPHSALFAGTDGMDVVQPLVAQAMQHPACCGIAMECKTSQWQWIDTLAKPQE